MKKVLVIEDHRDLRELIRAQINLKGFAAITAKNGKEGIETAIAEKPDMILMDIIMPEMDGWEATRILRGVTATKEVPIVAMTALFRPSDLQSCIEAGCNDYISKPFTLEELRNKITRLTSEWQSERIYSRYLVSANLSTCPHLVLVSFGLMAIPVRIHTATKSENVSFHLLHKKCGSRVRSQHYCPVCNVVVEREDLIRGFQRAKDKYVPISEEELESLEAEANRTIDLKEFIPLASVDPVYFENIHYLGADKGGEKPYRLLAYAMAKSGRVAIAELVSRGKEQLVLIRPYRKGLVLHTMYYANEVRDFNQVPKGETLNVSEQELELGIGLIDRLTSEKFKPENYKDEYRIRMLGMLDEKNKGKKIVVDTAPAPKRGQMIDIMEALKRSMERIPAKKKPAASAAKKKKKKVF